MSSDRVLVLLKSYLGDAVMATPLLHALSVKPLTVRGPDVVHDLLRAPDLPYRAMVSDRLKGFGRLLAEARKLKAEGFGAAILVNRSFRMALLAKLARIPMRIGHATEGRSWLLTETVPYDQAAPESQSYAELAQPLGIAVSGLIPRLWVSDEERAAGKERLAEASVGIQPGARYASKTIPHDVLVEITRRFMVEGLRPALFGGVEERPASTGFSPACLNLVGELSLRESMGVAAGLQVLVGGDTGFMHVAAAVGCPTVTVFGPTPAAKWAHRAPPHQVIEVVGGDVGKVSADEIWDAVQRIVKPLT